MTEAERKKQLIDSILSKFDQLQELRRKEAEKLNSNEIKQAWQSAFSLSAVQISISGMFYLQRGALLDRGSYIFGAEKQGGYKRKHSGHWGQHQDNKDNKNYVKL